MQHITDPTLQRINEINQLETKAFQANLKKSFLIHIGFALFFGLYSFVQGLYFPKSSLMSPPSLRVDLVALPDVLKKDKNKIGITVERKPAPKEEANPPAKPLPNEAAKPDEMVLRPKQSQKADGAVDRKRQMKNALSRIKSLEKISEDTGENLPKKIDALAALAKGNKLSKGSSLSDDAIESNEVGFYELVRDQLQANWELPAWLIRQNLSARVAIFIDSRGYILQLKFVKLSGNQQFDDAVKKTIQASQPFPIPPAEIAGDMMNSGIVVGFPL